MCSNSTVRLASSITAISSAHNWPLASSRERKNGPRQTRNTAEQKKNIWITGFIIFFVFWFEKEMQIWRRESTRRSVVNNIALAHIGYSVPTRHHSSYFSLIFFSFAEMGSLCVSLSLCCYLICFFFRSSFRKQMCCLCNATRLGGSFFISALCSPLWRRRWPTASIIYPLWSSRWILFPRTSRNSSRAGEVPLLAKMSSSVVWPKRWCSKPNLKWLTKTCSS